jgi:integrase
MDGEEATVLKGGVMQRTAAAQRALAYAKFHGLKERKPLHELRKLYGCLRRTDTKDIFLVQRELGHASPETTDSYYASARMSPTMVALWKEKYP